MVLKALYQPRSGNIVNRQGKATLAYIRSAHSLHPHHNYSH